MEPVIVIEKHIPYIKGVFDEVAEVHYLEPEKITKEVLQNTDALITRTRTKCNEALLAGSKCRIIATATIGTDHIDVPFCESASIKVVNAPGCNAPAVAQYVMASILTAYPDDYQQRTLGILGVGHVGSIVDRWARGLGMKTLLCDPPREENEGDNKFVSLDEMASQADIITFHTPHTNTGDYPTHHLCSQEFLSGLKRNPMIINSARGPIVDTPALIAALENGQVSKAVIDCWENEPGISMELLQQGFITTPHIAGYSRDGKLRATIAVIKAVSDFFGLKTEYKGDLPSPVPSVVTKEDILNSYNPLADTTALKTSPEQFEKMRNCYNLRREPTNYADTNKNS